MASGPETRGASGLSVEQFVIQAAPATAEAASAVAQQQPTHSPEEAQQESLQQALRDAFAAGVPGWGELVDSVLARLDDGGIVLIRGLRFDPENRLVLGLMAAFGRPSGFGNWNQHVVYDLFPIKRAPGAPDFEEFFHSGSQMHQRPHELQALQCVRQGSMGGGVSQLVQLDAALELMRQRGQQAEIELLQSRPFPFKPPRFLGESVISNPILEPHPLLPDKLAIRFQREPIFQAGEAEPACLDDAQRAAIAALEAAWNTPGVFLEYQLQPDELLLIDNRRVLHARTPVLGGPESGRHLKRIKAYRP